MTGAAFITLIPHSEIFQSSLTRGKCPTSTFCFTQKMECWVCKMPSTVTCLISLLCFQQWIVLDAFQNMPMVTYTLLCVHQSKISPWSPAGDHFVLWNMKTDNNLVHFRRFFFVLSAVWDSTSDVEQGSALLLHLPGEQHTAVGWGLGYTGTITNC